MSIIKTNTLSTLDGSYSVPSETLARGACRAWVNFNGTGTVAIRASFNVSSITDLGTGQYRINYTNSLSDTNYSVTSACSGTSFTRLDTLATDTLSISTLSTNGVTGQDTTTVSLAVFR